MKLAVFVSGSGSNMLAIQDGIESGAINAEISLVVSNTSKAGALEKAKLRGISTLVLSSKQFPNTESYSSSLAAKLREHNIEAILLAGYLKMIPAEIILLFENKILNIHPSLLPAFGGKGFYGSKVHQAVLDRGTRWTGVTIHFVNPVYDEGPIVLQEPVEVLPEDTLDSLSKRVLKTEHILYPKAVALLAENKLKVENGIVTIEA